MNIIVEIEKDNEPQDLADIVFVLNKNKFLMIIKMLVSCTTIMRIK